MGTQVLTGLVIMATIALGHCLAMFVAMSLIMPALTLKRSSRVIPGLRGTPAGITTTSEPWKRRDKNKYYIAYGMYFDLFIFYYTNKILWYDKRRSLTTVGKKNWYVQRFAKKSINFILQQPIMPCGTFILSLFCCYTMSTGQESFYGFIVYAFPMMIEFLIAKSMQHTMIW